MEVQNFFANSGVNITTEGKIHLGRVIGNTEYCNEYVKDLVKDCKSATASSLFSIYLSVALKANLTTSWEPFQTFTTYIYL